MHQTSTTICTNNETMRSTLSSALAVAGASDDEIAEIVETDEDEIWVEVLDSLDFDYATDGAFPNWNGGKRKQFGYHSGCVSHSTTSQADADQASDAVRAALALVAPTWLALHRAAEVDA